MPSPILRALRFARSWSGSPAPVREERAAFRTSRGERALLLVVPEEGPIGAPWVVLHGITRTGISHPQLLRFVRALASTGAPVLLPEVPEWKDLRLVSAPLVPTLEAALGEARARGWGAGVAVGFSFGCPQLLVAAADPRLRGRLRGILGYGGYADPVRALRFLLTGEHEWGGRGGTLRPNPYGLWVMAANFLERSPGLGDAGDVAGACRRLASVCGERFVDGDDPELEPLKAELEAGIRAERRPLFRTLADPGRADRDAALGLADRLAEGLAAADGESDPRPFLDRIEVPVRLVHGRSDRIIPWTETLRLEDAFPPEADVRASVTGLYGHSRGGGGLGALETLIEGVGFVAAVRGVLALSEG